MLLHNATLLDGSQADVRLEGGRIAEVGPPATIARDGAEALDLSGYVLLVAPAEPHAHLDKALTAERVEVQAGHLHAAIEAWHAHRADLGADDIARRAESAALIALGRGVTGVRTHVDVGEGIEVRAAEALVEVRDRLRPLMDIQVVALSYPLAGAAGAENRALVRAALELGVDVLGGAPHIDPDPVGHIEVCLELAAEFGRPIDLHMDEHLRSSVDLEHLVRLMGDGFPQPVTASHCTSLGMRPVEVQERVAAEVARAGIAVVTCPGTNLHLLGRGVRTATPRGLTALPALLDAGVLVAGGGDNVQDFFHPLGCGDALHTATLLVLAGQLDVQTAYRLVSENARAVMGLAGGGVAPGGPGDLLAVAAGSLQEALSTTTEDRIVFRGGAVVRRTSVVADQNPSLRSGFSIT
jgi:cytosine/creatinine deaminase